MDADPQHNAGMIYGYARVSTDAQDLAIQLATLKAAGCEKVFHNLGRRLSRDKAGYLSKSLKMGAGQSGWASFRALASRRSALTSSGVAARAVLPASRRLPASRNSLDQP